MFELHQDYLMRMAEEQQNTPRDDRDTPVDRDIDYQPLSLAEYERTRSGSNTKKRQFGNRAYNKIFRHVQKQL